MTSPNEALQIFMAWFVENYPSGCTLTDPAWHAPKILRKAQAALQSASEGSDTAKQGWEQECKDGDRILALFPHLQRTEGGWLPVAKIVNEISELAARCKRADAPQPSQAVLNAYTRCAELCKKHASICVRMGDGEKARTSATLADAILAARDALRGKP
jgi:hypothetical protein